MTPPRTASESVNDDNRGVEALAWRTLLSGALALGLGAAGVVYVVWTIVEEFAK